ncbi:uncharacterized protein LOC134853206 isoform X2 [Symsagittifera roscoffensis]|uniref:uncharacterized protein LOC134853206 isoform X2 n=1 Tax=Symsagittifera roscoffensis TaxID=84072 RepID=UPI00307B8869
MFQKLSPSQKERPKIIQDDNQGGVDYSKFSHDYTSTWFQLPGQGDKTAEVCLLYSNYFCLMSWFTRAKRERKAIDSDAGNFFSMVVYKFHRLNFFSLAAIEHERCCKFQVWVYREKGQKYGYGPLEYLKSLSNFSSFGKRLNYISAKFNDTFCLNIIYRVGFGTGELVMKGVSRNTDSLIFPPNFAPEVFLFHISTIQQELSFEWFKQKIVCKDQPWICQLRASKQDLATLHESDESL